MEADQKVFEIILASRRHAFKINNVENTLFKLTCSGAVSMRL